MGAVKVEAKAANDKVLRLQAHLEKLENRLNGKQVGVKHSKHPYEYFQWLKREMDRTKKKIEALKLTI
jgi:predicted  nucleic acid-binding Zn-ribbon protein